MAYDNKIGDGARAGRLLEKYFEGETTLDEEKWLKGYFSSAADIPPRLEYARAMFGFFDGAASGTAPGEIVHPAHRGQADSVMAADPGENTVPVADAAAFEGRTRDADGSLALPSGRRPVSPKSLRARLALSALTAAAVLAVALLLLKSGGFSPVEEQVVYCYVNGVPVTDAELALEYTRAMAGHVSETFGEPLREVGSALGNLERLGVLADIIDLIDYE